MNFATVERKGEHLVISEDSEKAQNELLARNL